MSSRNNLNIQQNKVAIGDVFGKMYKKVKSQLGIVVPYAVAGAVASDMQRICTMPLTDRQGKTKKGKELGASLKKDINNTANSPRVLYDKLRHKTRNLAIANRAYAYAKHGKTDRAIQIARKHGVHLTATAFYPAMHQSAKKNGRVRKDMNRLATNPTALENYKNDVGYRIGRLKAGWVNKSIHKMRVKDSDGMEKEIKSGWAWCSKTPQFVRRHKGTLDVKQVGDQVHLTHPKTYISQYMVKNAKQIAKRAMTRGFRSQVRAWERTLKNKYK